MLRDYCNRKWINEQIFCTLLCNKNAIQTNGGLVGVFTRSTGLSVNFCTFLIFCSGEGDDRVVIVNVLDLNTVAPWIDSHCG